MFLVEEQKVDQKNLNSVVHVNDRWRPIWSEFLFIHLFLFDRILKFIDKELLPTNFHLICYEIFSIGLKLVVHLTQLQLNAEELVAVSWGILRMRNLLKISLIHQAFTQSTLAAQKTTTEHLQPQPCETLNTFLVKILQQVDEFPQRKPPPELAKKPSFCACRP